MRVAIDDAGTVVVSGVIDVETCDTFDRTLRSALDGATRSLVIDMTGVEFMDSSGLRVLLSVHERCVADDVDLRFAPSPAVRRLLEITGLAAGGFGDGELCPD
jgi:anti-sigma B factor antagonist